MGNFFWGLEDLEQRTIAQKIKAIDIEKRKYFELLSQNKKMSLRGYGLKITPQASEQRFRLFGKRDRVELFIVHLNTLAQAGKITPNDYQCTADAVHLSATALYVLLTQGDLISNNIVSNPKKQKAARLAKDETFIKHLNDVVKLEQLRTKALHYDLENPENPETWQNERIEEAKNLRRYNNLHYLDYGDGKGEWRFEDEHNGRVYIDDTDLPKLGKQPFFVRDSQNFFSGLLKLPFRNPLHGWLSKFIPFGGKFKRGKTMFVDGVDDLAEREGSGNFTGESGEAHEEGTDLFVYTAPIALVFLLEGIKGALEDLKEAELGVKEQRIASWQKALDKSKQKIIANKSEYTEPEKALSEMIAFLEQVAAIKKQLNKEQSRHLLHFFDGKEGALNLKKREKDAIAAMAGGVLAHAGAQLMEFAEHSVAVRSAEVLTELNSATAANLLEVGGTAIGASGQLQMAVVAFMNSIEEGGEALHFSRIKKHAKSLQQDPKKNPIDFGFTLPENQRKGVVASLKAHGRSKAGLASTEGVLLGGQTVMHAAWIYSIIQSGGATAGVGAFTPGFAAKTFETPAVQSLRSAGAYLTIGAAVSKSVAESTVLPAAFPELTEQQQEKIDAIMAQKTSNQDKIDAANKKADNVIDQYVHTSLFNYIHAMVEYTTDTKHTTEQQAAQTPVYKAWLWARKGLRWAGKAVVHQFEHRKAKLDQARALLKAHLEKENNNPNEVDETLVDRIYENYIANLKTGIPSPFFRGTGYKYSFFQKNASFTSVIKAHLDDEEKDKENKNEAKYKAYIRELLVSYQNGQPHKQFDALALAMNRAAPPKSEKDGVNTTDTETQHATDEPKQINEDADKRYVKRLKETFNALPEKAREELEASFMNRLFLQSWHLELLAGNNRYVEKVHVQKVRKAKFPLLLLLSPILLLTLIAVSAALPLFTPYAIGIVMLLCTPEIFGALMQGVAGLVNGLARKLGWKHYECRGQRFYRIKNILTREFSIPGLIWKWSKIRALRLPKLKGMTSKPYHTHLPNAKTLKPSWRKDKVLYRFKFDTLFEDFEKRLNGTVSEDDNIPSLEKLKYLGEVLKRSMLHQAGSVKAKEQQAFIEALRYAVPMLLIEEQMENGWVDFNQRFAKQYSDKTAKDFSEKLLLDAADKKVMLYTAKQQTLQHVKDRATIADKKRGAAESAAEAAVKDAEQPPATPAEKETVKNLPGQKKLKQFTAEAIQIVDTRNRLAWEKLKIQALDLIDSTEGVNQDAKQTLKSAITNFTNDPKQVSKQQLEKQIQEKLSKTTKAQQNLKELLFLSKNTAHTETLANTYTAVKNDYLTLSGPQKCAIPWAVSDVSLFAFFVKTEKSNNPFANAVRKKARHRLSKEDKQTLKEYNKGNDKTTFLDGLNNKEEFLKELTKARSQARLDALAERQFNATYGKNFGAIIAKPYQHQKNTSSPLRSSRHRTGKQTSKYTPFDKEAKQQAEIIATLKFSLDFQIEIVTQLHDYQYLETDPERLAKLKLQYTLEHSILEERKQQLQDKLAALKKTLNKEHIEGVQKLFAITPDHLPKQQTQLNSAVQHSRYGVFCSPLNPYKWYKKCFRSNNNATRSPKRSTTIRTA